MEVLLVLAGICVVVWTGIALYIAILLNRAARILRSSLVGARLASYVFRLWQKI